MPGLASSFDLADIIERLQEGLQVIGPDLTYLYVNPAAASHGQRSVDELLGSTMTDAYPGIEHTNMFAHLRRVMDDGVAHAMENEFVFPDGTARWFELRMSRIPQGVLVLSVDITDRKRWQARMHRAERMDAVGQLAGGIAHDFNNLLTIIHAHLFMLDEAVGDTNAEVAEDVQRALEATRRGAELTRKLLTFARQIPVGAQQVAVTRALRDLDRLLRRVLGENVVLKTEASEGVGSVWMDPTAFDQVFMNLAINARDAMPEGGNLTIEAEPITLNERWSEGHAMRLEPGRYVVISVTDTGMGMPPHVLERLFEPFFTTKDERGTGLGLATCWGLVGQAGGAITVYSEEGAGTTFRVYLPRADEAARSEAPPPARAEPVTDARILLVEDDDAVRAVIARILRGEGYKVIEADSAGDAVLLAEDVGDQLDLLLTDVVMPRMSGLELADRLRRRLPSLRLLFMSGFAPRALARDGYSVPGVPFLAKPFAPEALIAAVAKALR